MNDSSNNDTFGDLPQALVEELLGKSQEVGNALYSSFSNIQNQKKKFREDLEKGNILKREADYSVSVPPTTCGIDGAYAKEELLSVDLLAAAAVALEGITPPSETRFWEGPHHQVIIQEEKHNPDTNTILRAIMIGMEQQLAEKAPHDVVFIDGSLTTPLIFFNQAINKAEESDDNRELSISKKLFEVLPESLASYRKVLGNSRTDKLWVGMPKYTTNREIGRSMKWDQSYDDRALLTLLLAPGELTTPLPFQKPSQPWHLTYKPCEKDIQSIKDSLGGLRVIYYRPHVWTPALRIELNSHTAANEYQLGMVLQAVKFQCATAGIIEPYPLYIADRMVKSLGTGLPAFRQVVTRQMAEDYDGDIGEVFFTMHGYRTERSK